jgi:PAS domain S-box-containing protein
MLPHKLPSNHIPDLRTSEFTSSKDFLGMNINNILNQHATICVFDPAGIITYANEKFCSLYQSSPENLTGKTFESINANVLSPSFFVQLWDELNKGKTWQGEIRIKVTDGSYRWADTVITPLPDKYGVLSTFVAILTETTHFKKAEEKIQELLTEARDVNEEMKASEEELRQTLEHAVSVNEKISRSEARYRLISESMRDMICLHHLDGTYSYVSKSVKTLLGYTPEELIGTNPYQLFHPDDILHIKEEAHNLAKAGAEHTYIQYRIRKSDGTYTWFETLTYPIKDEYGKTNSLHTASRDISRRKMAEDQRDNFIKHSLELMVIADTEGRILRVNSSWEKTFSYSSEQIEGHSLFHFIHPDDVASTIEAKNNKRDSGNATIVFENRYRCKDGSYRWLSWNSISFTKEGIMYGFARDVTERKEKEEVLKRTLEELKTRNHELDNYVYKVSHDLRAPLTSIMGLINLIKMEQDMAAVQRYVSLIENRVNKSDQFILSIINHSKILNAETEVNQIDFEHIITDCFEELKFITNTARIKCILHINGQVPFYNDLFRINIILKNFISNAIKYLNPSVTENFVNFDIIIDDKQASILITDNGIGIDKAYQHKMFDMFFRGTPASDGSGLGLYIVKQTLEQLGGKVSVDSEAGKGTSFHLIIPNELNKNV